MAEQVAQGSLAAQLGPAARKAWDEHKADDIKWGMSNLPEGITRGVAQLMKVEVSKLKADTKDKDIAGKPCVIFTGIAKQPQEFKGQPVEGLRVMITLSMCATPTKKYDGQQRLLPQAIRQLLNEFKKFQVATEETTIDDADAIIAHLNETKPYYFFSTRGWTPEKRPGQKEDPTRMVLIQFDGRCEYDEESGTAAGAVVDESANGAVFGGDANADGALDHVAQTQETPVGEESAQAGAEENGDTESLVAELEAMVAGCGEGTDEEQVAAQESLIDMAVQSGIPREEALSNKYSDWTDLAQAIIDAGGPKKETPAEPEPVKEPEPPKAEAKPATGDPQKGKTCKFQEVDDKGNPKLDLRKKPKKPVACEIHDVQKKSKTVTLRNLVDGKTLYKGVKWAQLLPA